MFAGVPSTFIRTSGCNLRCVWCDTPYASWHPEGPVVPVEEVFEQVQMFGNRHVVITGGEPMIFDATTELCAKLKGAGYLITIETAGTVFRELDCDLMSISPKLSHSTPLDDSTWAVKHESLRLNFDALRGLAMRYSCQFKFVVAAESLVRDVSEIEQIVSQLAFNEDVPVYLMPEGRDAARIWATAKLLVDVCMARGWRLGPRLQIDLFGDTRGT